MYFIRKIASLSIFTLSQFTQKAFARKLQRPLGQGVIYPPVFEFAL